jgi:hypothetical protein
MSLREQSFREELRMLINRYSVESNSDTPDFILADYISDALDAFDEAIRQRDQWHGFVTFEGSRGHV